MRYLLKHGHLIIDGNREFLDGAILIEDGRIAEVFPQTDRIREPFEDCVSEDLKGSLVMPGFFDTHTHGAMGSVFDSADQDSLDEIAHRYALDGTTSFLATLSYDLSEEDFCARLKDLENYQSPYSRFEGIHMEGPFLSPKYAGAGDPNKFLRPEPETVKKFLASSSRIRQITVACELEGASEIASFLHQNGIRVMCGHSAAVYEDLDGNVDGFTHLFNAMRGLHHRDKTLVNCAFMNRWYCELIADGIHIDRNVLKLILDQIDRDLIILISDSSPARGMPDGEYPFLSHRCIRKGGAFLTEDGHLAGSVASILNEMKVLYELGAKYTDLLLYSSLNAFRFYGLDQRFGTIEKGKYADLVFLSDDLEMKKVMIGGNWIHE